MSVPPFIVSMASMNIAKVIAAVFTKTQSVSWPQSSDPVNGWFRNCLLYTSTGFFVMEDMEKLLPQIEVTEL